MPARSGRQVQPGVPALMNRRRPAAAAGQVRRAASRSARPASPLFADPVEISERFEKGEEVDVVDIPLSLLKNGDWLRFSVVKYERGDIKLAGKVLRIEVEGSHGCGEAPSSSTPLPSGL